MAYGHPVVAAPPSAGFLTPSRTGSRGCWSRRDPVALRAALERLLEDAVLRRRLGESARERARERFSWSVATGATVAAYRAAVM